jgi:hypothetical protein
VWAGFLGRLMIFLELRIMMNRYSFDWGERLLRHDSLRWFARRCTFALCAAPRCPDGAPSRCSASPDEIWCASVHFAGLLRPVRRCSHYAAHSGTPLAIGAHYCYDGAALPCFRHEVSPMLSTQALLTRFDIIVVAADPQVQPTIWSQ